MPANDLATALTSPLAYVYCTPMFQRSGSASGSDLVNSMFVGQNEHGEWMLFGNDNGGFGAAVSLRGNKSSRGSNYTSVKPDVPAEAPLTISEQVYKARSALGLNVSELAQVLQVTRPTVYGWLKGIEPHPAAVGRLAKLMKVANVVSDKKLTRIDSLVRRPISQSPFNGASLLTLIASDSAVSSAHIDLLATLDQREVNARSEVKGLNLLRTTQEAIDDPLLGRSNA